MEASSIVAHIIRVAGNQSTRFVDFQIIIARLPCLVALSQENPGALTLRSVGKKRHVVSGFDTFV